MPAPLLATLALSRLRYAVAVGVLLAMLGAAAVETNLAWAQAAAPAPAPASPDQVVLGEDTGGEVLPPGAIPPTPIGLPEPGAAPEAAPAQAADAADPEVCPDPSAPAAPGAPENVAAIPMQSPAALVELMGLDPIWQPLATRLLSDGEPAEEMAALFGDPELGFRPEAMSGKMIALIKAKLSQPVAPEGTPASASSESEDAPELPDLSETRYVQYFSSTLLDRGQTFVRDHSEALARIEAEQGVSGPALVAVMLVETKLGGYLGSTPTLATLASMAACEDFRNVQPYLPMNSLSGEMRSWVADKTRDKAEWAYAELKALLDYCRLNGLDPRTVVGSPYGAIGLCQFMPSNALRFARDGNGDGRADLFAPDDALASIAAYLAYHGWRPQADDEHRLKALYHYNHDRDYAAAVLELSGILTPSEQAAR